MVSHVHCVAVGGVVVVVVVGGGGGGKRRLKFVRQLGNL